MKNVEFASQQPTLARIKQHLGIQRIGKISHAYYGTSVEYKVGAIISNINKLRALIASLREIGWRIDEQAKYKMTGETNLVVSLMRKDDEEYEDKWEQMLILTQPKIILLG